ALAAAGIKEQDVNMLSMEITDMPDAFEKGNVDALAAWEPYAHYAFFSSTAHAIIYRNISLGFIYFSKAFFVDNNDKAVYAIIAAEIRALKWLNQDTKNLYTAIEWTKTTEGTFAGKKALLTTLQIADLARKDLIGRAPQPRIPQYETTEEGVLYKEFTFLKQIGKIATDIKWQHVKDSFNFSIVDDILANTQKYEIDTFSYE
ncbi:MAG: ABC transporter substrate-binding protein, partial [Candidatus Magnetoovum sp. WYHC-5]|nr:ABC transporter substrate-binding protein [Candidatus Magnetoovum sp. WYHC-5]